MSLTSEVKMLPIKPAITERTTSSIGSNGARELQPQKKSFWDNRAVKIVVIVVGVTAIVAAIAACFFFIPGAPLAAIGATMAGTTAAGLGMSAIAASTFLGWGMAVGAPIAAGTIGGAILIGNYARCAAVAKSKTNKHQSGANIAAAARSGVSLVGKAVKKTKTYSSKNTNILDELEAKLFHDNEDSEVKENLKLITRIGSITIGQITIVNNDGKSEEHLKQEIRQAMVLLKSQNDTEDTEADQKNHVLADIKRGHLIEIKKEDKTIKICREKIADPVTSKEKLEDWNDELEKQKGQQLQTALAGIGDLRARKNVLMICEQKGIILIQKSIQVEERLKELIPCERESNENRTIIDTSGGNLLITRKVKIGFYNINNQTQEMFTRNLRKYDQTYDVEFKCDLKKNECSVTYISTGGLTEDAPKRWDD